MRYHRYCDQYRKGMMNMMMRMDVPSSAGTRMKKKTNRNTNRQTIMNNDQMCRCVIVALTPLSATYDVADAVDNMNYVEFAYSPYALCCDDDIEVKSPRASQYDGMN